MEKSEKRNLVLVGTYRPENAAWIRERRLYNLPIAATSPMGSDPIDGNMLTTRAAEAYGRFKSVVLFAGDAPAMAFAASFREVVDRDWLKANGYAVAKTPHGAYVNASDLKRYGRTDVTFYKIDDENFVLDFARKEKK